VQVVFLTARPTLRIAPLPPPNCPSGEDLGEESGETFVCATFQLYFHWPRRKNGTVNQDINEVRKTKPDIFYENSH
jgi:hypothetical protein